MVLEWCLWELPPRTKSAKTSGMRLERSTPSLPLGALGDVLREDPSGRGSPRTAWIEVELCDDLLYKQRHAAVANACVSSSHGTHTHPWQMAGFASWQSCSASQAAEQELLAQLLQLLQNSSKLLQGKLKQYLQGRAQWLTLWCWGEKNCNRLSATAIHLIYS